MLFQPIFDLKDANSLIDFKSKFMKQNAQQDQDRAEYLVRLDVIDRLKQQPNSIGTAMWLQYVRYGNVFLIFIIVTYGQL